MKPVTKHVWRNIRDKARVDIYLSGRNTGIFGYAMLNISQRCLYGIWDMLTEVFDEIN